MDLSAHYQSYTGLINKSALEDSKEYAKTLPTKSPQFYPTVYDFLMYAGKCVRKAIDDNNTQSYKSWLCNHQKGLIALYEKMVEEVLPPNPTKDDIMLLIEEKGWKWFKFCPLALKITMSGITAAPLTMNWVPRYYTKSSEGLCLDADELEQIFHIKDPERTKKALGTKLMKCDHKWFIRDTDEFEHLASVNHTLVSDWTMPLFPKALL